MCRETPSAWLYAIVLIGVFAAHAALHTPARAACDCAAAQVTAGVEARPGGSSLLLLDRVDPRHAALAYAAAAGGTDRGRPPASFGRTGGEFGAATVAATLSGLAAVFVGMAASFNCNSTSCTLLSQGGAAALYATGCSTGPWLVGNLGDQRVPFVYPFTGAAIGAGAGYGLLVASGSTGNAGGVVLGFALAPIGATIGAVLGRRYDGPRQIAAGGPSLCIMGPRIIATPAAHSGASGGGVEVLALRF